MGRRPVLRNTVQSPNSEDFEANSEDLNPQQEHLASQKVYLRNLVWLYMTGHLDTDRRLPLQASERIHSFPPLMLCLPVLPLAQVISS